MLKYIILRIRRVALLARQTSVSKRLSRALDSKGSEALCSLFSQQTFTSPDGAFPSVMEALQTSFRSDDFQIGTLKPLLDGSAGVELDWRIGAAACRWLSGTFGLMLGVDRRLEVLAQIVRIPQVTAFLAGEPTPWSGGALAQAVFALTRPGTQRRASMTDALKDLAKGVVLLDVDPDPPLLSGPGWLIQDDLIVSFVPTRAVIAGSSFCQLDFGVISSARDPLGSLMLDYGPGVEVGVSLVPRGRAMYSAFVVSKGLRRIRWKLDDSASEVRITALSARPVWVGTLASELKSSVAPIDVDRFCALASLIDDAVRPPIIALRLSRLLTRVLGGHRGAERSYAAWIRRHETSGRYAEREQTTMLANLRRAVRISIIVQVPPCHQGLASTLASFISQSHSDWEAWVLSPGAIPPKEFQDHPQVRHLDCRGQGVEDLNAALARVTGGWVCRMVAGDRLASGALIRLAAALADAPNTVVAYTDEDRLSADGIRENPIFKPDFSPEYLISHNYVGRFALYRTDLLQEGGGWRSGYSTASDHDLLLRLTVAAPGSTVLHVPKLLIHLGRADDPLADGAAPPNVGEQKAVVDHLIRLGLSASVEVTPSGGLHVRPQLRNSPLVSLIIPTRDRPDMLRGCVESILSASSYTNYELLIVDNQSAKEDTLELLDKYSHYSCIRVLSYPYPFNYSSLNNFGVSQSLGTVIGLINNDVEVISHNWIEEMAGWALAPSIGCVGAKLYYSDRRIQHAGIILGVGGVAGHAHKFLDGEADGYAGRLRHLQNLSAVTGACLFVSRSTYETVGGLDERLPVAFNDVDLCLRVRARGYRNLWTPFAQLYHHESATRGFDDTFEKRQRFYNDSLFMYRRWGDQILRDPCYSPELTREKEDFSLAWLED